MISKILSTLFILLFFRVFLASEDNKSILSISVLPGIWRLKINSFNGKLKESFNFKTSFKRDEFHLLEEISQEEYNNLIEMNPEVFLVPDVFMLIMQNNSIFINQEHKKLIPVCIDHFLDSIGNKNKQAALDFLYDFAKEIPIHSCKYYEIIKPLQKKLQAPIEEILPPSIKAILPPSFTQEPEPLQKILTPPINAILPTSFTNNKINKPMKELIHNKVAIWKAQGKIVSESRLEILHHLGNLSTIPKSKRKKNIYNNYYFLFKELIHNRVDVWKAQGKIVPPPLLKIYAIERYHKL